MEQNNFLEGEFYWALDQFDLEKLSKGKHQLEKPESMNSKPMSIKRGKVFLNPHSPKTQPNHKIIFEFSYKEFAGVFNGFLYPNLEVLGKIKFDLNKAIDAEIKGFYKWDVNENKILLMGNSHNSDKTKDGFVMQLYSSAN